MQVLELFSGTKSFSMVAEKFGYTSFTVDNDERLKPDLCMDVLDFNPKRDYFGSPYIIWASPPCTCFSVASIGKHWTGGKNKYIPKTEEAINSIRLVTKTVALIMELKPKYYFIENPRGVLRKLGLIPFPRKTCCYSRYGDVRMKPTDIWTNLDWLPKMDHNGCKSHEMARRGMKTGTQGLKDSVERGRVPERLCEELLLLIEKNYSFEDYHE